MASIRLCNCRKIPPTDGAQSNVYHRVVSICDDFHNLAASLAKLRHFHKVRREIGEGNAAAFAVTEVEYILVVARSLFDLLQECISLIWNNRITLVDPANEKLRKQKKLPFTFSKVILKNKHSVKTATEIQQSYTLPYLLAQEYEKHASFFLTLRAHRDGIIHGLSRQPVIFSTEKGFCVQKEMSPFNCFSGWRESHRYNDNLVSILPWIAHIVFQSIQSCNELILALAKQVQFPPEIAPGLHVFIRGLNTNALLDLSKVADGETWWEDKDTLIIKPY